jgi:penicillin amidase
MFPPGQSGHLGSPHYDDLIEPWLKGDYHPMLWTREQVIENAEGRLLLKGA